MNIKNICKRIRKVLLFCGLIIAIGLASLPDSVIFAETQQSLMFFVAADGKDSNDGSIDSPFATIEKARDAIRALKSENGGNLPAGGVTVNLREGSYKRTVSFTLEQQDSGTQDVPIVYQAYNGEKVSLTGGANLEMSSFSSVTDESILQRLPVESRGKIVQLDLKTVGIADYGEILQFGMGLPSVVSPPQLYADDQAMTLARWPNEGYVRIKSVIDRGANGTKGKGGVFTYDDNRPANWKKTDDIWMYGFWKQAWADSNTKVASIDLEKKAITTVQPHKYGYDAVGKYYYYNILEEIDMPGEYYLDRSNGVLYFYPPEKMQKPEVTLSLLKQDMVVMNQVSNVTFKGITFETTCAGGFVIKDGTNVLINECSVCRTGQMAVTIDGGSNDGVSNSAIFDNGNGGILLSGGDRATLTPANHYAVNNHIYNYARINRTYTPAVRLWGVGNRAANNVVHGADHYAMNFSGNDHIIEYNEIYDVMRDSDDCGAIYAGRDFTGRGNIIRYNFIHDCKGGSTQFGATGVYLDDRFSSAEVTGNIFYNIQQSIRINGGRENVFSNNMMINVVTPIYAMGAGKSPSEELLTRLNAVPYQSEIWAQKYPRLKDILNDQPELAKYNVITNNVIYQCNKMVLNKEVAECGTSNNNVIFTEDPGFQDINNLNFNLKDDALVFKQIPEFKKIPFDQIGLN